jgi:hypothetical protein
MMLGDPGFRPPLSHQVGYQPYIGSVPLAAPGLGAAMQGIAQALGVGSSTARSRQGMPVSRRKPPARPLQPGLLGPILDELQAKSAINRIREGEWDQRPLPVFGAWPQSQAPGQPPASWHDDPMAALMQGIEHALHGGNSIDRGRAQSQTQFQTRAEGNASVQPWATEWNQPTDLAQTPNAWQSVPMQPTPETLPPLRLGLLGPILDDLEAEAPQGGINAYANHRHERAIEHKPIDPKQQQMSGDVVWLCKYLNERNGWCRYWCDGAGQVFEKPSVGFCPPLVRQPEGL